MDFDLKEVLKEETKKHVKKKTEEENEELINDYLTHCLALEKPYRYNVTWFSHFSCNGCGERKKSKCYYQCFECEDFQICKVCYYRLSEEGKLHLHGKKNWFVSINRPGWEFVMELLDNEEISIPMILEKCFQEYAHRYFVGYRETLNQKQFEWLRFLEVKETSHKVRNFMVETLRLKEGQFVGVVCDISIEYVYIFFACMFGGFVLVPIQEILSNDEKKHIIEQTGVKVVFVKEKFYTDMLSIAKSVGKEDEKNFLISMGEKDSAFEKMLRSETEKKGKMKYFRWKEDHIVSIIYTSGTTGMPKGIVFRERAFIEEMTKKNHTVPLIRNAFVPFSHISGLNNILVSFFNGGRFALLTDSKILNVFDDMRIIRPTIFIGFPRILQHLYNKYCDTPEDKKKECKKEICEIFGNRLIDIVVGGAKSSYQVKKFFRDLLVIPVYDGFGVTEVGSISFNFTQMKNCQIKLVDVPELGYSKTDEPYPRGELAVRNFLTCNLEYFKNEEETERKFDEDGYFYTGDIVEIRDKRKIVVIDRKSNTIKLSQGEFVSLEKVETILATSPLIDQILLCCDPNKTKLIAIIVPQNSDGSKRELLEDIFKIGKENQLNPWELPQNVLLSKTPFKLTGLQKKNRRKILKQFESELKELFGSEKSAFDDVFQKILKNNEIDKTKTFLELGGDSLKGMQIMQKFKNFGRSIKFEELMNKPIGKIKETKMQKEKSIFVSIEKEKFKLNHVIKILRKREVKRRIEKIRNVFLTGASGFLGVNILRELLRALPDAKIFCLIRKFSVKHFTVDEKERVEIVEGNLVERNFGLTEDAFAKLKSEMDLIIHCGSMVNHFLSYEDHYGTNVESVYDIVRLSCGFKRIIYISSSSVYDDSNVREDIENDKHRITNGYSSSKWACDVLLKSCYENCVIIRPTLIIGSTKTGEFNERDWFVRVIRAIYDFKIAPSTNIDTEMNMIPVDLVAYIVGKVVKKRDFIGHMNVGMKNVTMKKVVEYLEQVLREKGEKLEMFPFQKWVEEVEKRVETVGDHPIVPFLDILRINGRIGGSNFIDYPLDELQKFGKEDKDFQGVNRKLTLEDMKKIDSRI